jgi:hypothetical protein
MRMKNWSEKLGNVRFMVLGIALILLAAMWLLRRILG